MIIKKKFIEKRYVKILLASILLFVIFGLLSYLTIELFTSLIDNYDYTNTIGPYEISNKLLSVILTIPMLIIFSIRIAFILNPKWKFEASKGYIPWYKGKMLKDPSDYKKLRKNIFDREKIEWKQNKEWYDRLEIKDIVFFNADVTVLLKSKKNDMEYPVLVMDLLKIMKKFKGGQVSGHFRFSRHKYSFGIKYIDKNRSN